MNLVVILCTGYHYETWLCYGYTMLTNGRYILTYKDPLVRPFWKSPMSSRTTPTAPQGGRNLGPLRRGFHGFHGAFSVGLSSPAGSERVLLPAGRWFQIPRAVEGWAGTGVLERLQGVSWTLTNYQNMGSHQKKRPDDCCFSKLLQLDCHILDGVSHGKTDCIFANDCTSSDVRVCDDLSPHETGSTR